MCGICGIYYFDKDKVVERKTVERMCQSFSHRGPDDEGIFIEGNIGLGHRRLKVIDLVGGHQPMANEKRTIWIVFNGEIYNFRELREKLLKRGHSFSTESDTEVIIHLYEDLGNECVQKLNGMFAFAIWDSVKEELFLARDRLGIKPLYYHLDGHRIAFASELRTLLQEERVPREVDLESLDGYLSFGYFQAPGTILRGVKKLLPGHLMLVKRGKVSWQQYWNLRFVGGKEQRPEYYIEQFRERLRETVRKRLVSDVPLGAFLSGGLDSSSIVALMSQLVSNPIKTFSIGFRDPSFSELDYSRLAAKHLGTEHYELIVQKDIAQLGEEVMDWMDEPQGEYSSIPSYLVSKLAREQVTVSLSGDGSDEILAGYDSYRADRLAHLYDKFPNIIRRCINRFGDNLPARSRKRGVVNIFKKFLYGIQFPEELGHCRWLTLLSSSDKELLYSKYLQEKLTNVDPYRAMKTFFQEVEGVDWLSRELYVDIKTSLSEVQLTRLDSMSMAHALEARVPLLDHELVEFTATIPSNLKLRGLTGKFILKKSMADLLPPEIINRAKEGFSCPMKNWIGEEMRELLTDTLSEKRVRQRGLFNYEYIVKLIEEHRERRRNNSQLLWILLLLERWCQKHIDRG